jgi:hypothetical protein
MVEFILLEEMVELVVVEQQEQEQQIILHQVLELVEQEQLLQ